MYGVKEAMMTGENFKTKFFYSQTRGYVLTPFFDTCLADAKARKTADGCRAV
jgi:hypothetical protein